MDNRRDCSYFKGVEMMDQTCDNCGNKLENGECSELVISRGKECVYWVTIPTKKTRKQTNNAFAKRLGW